MTHSTASPTWSRAFWLAACILAATTAIRLIGLKYSVVDLYVDEAQYWWWSRDLAFGYFSKPPLLPWLISASTHICGNGEACIRAPSPIFYCGTGLIVYAIARQLYGERVALLSAVSFAIGTGVVFSARIISTDVPLLFFWALALLAYVKLLSDGDWRWAVLLGAALGFGLLAKYAMIYFLLGMALAAWLEQDARNLLRGAGIWLAMAIAVVMIAPNVIWNLDNGFVTFRHTGHNISGAGVDFDIVRALGFVAAQFGVFGPILFAVLLIGMARLLSPRLIRADRLMLAFAIPPLALITVVGFVTNANANWAAPAFVSGSIVAVALLAREKAWKWLAASITCGVIAQVALLYGDSVATRLRLPLGGDIYHRVLGWRSLGEQAGQLAERIGARTIVADNRYAAAALLYYWRNGPQQIAAWQAPYDDFELATPLTADSPRPMLYVTDGPVVDVLRSCFSGVEALGEFDTPTGPTTVHHYFAFRLTEPRGPIGPLQVCGS